MRSSAMRFHPRPPYPVGIHITLCRDQMFFILGSKDSDFQTQAQIENEGLFA